MARLLDFRSHSKSGPFANQPLFDHSKSRLVQISDPHCIVHNIQDTNLVSIVFSGAEDYQVLFEDSSYADGYSPPLHVAQRYIITVPEKKKGK